MPNTKKKTKASKATKATPKKQPEAIAMLVRDHKMVKAMFEEFEDLEDDASKKQLSDKVCDELTVHATLEEKTLYPAAREVLEETEMMDEAEVEHQVAKDLIAKLRRMSAGDERLDATFKVLSEYVMHHVEEEESEMFPQVLGSDIDFDELAEEMLATKRDLRAKMDLPLDDEEEEGVLAGAGAKAPGRKTQRSS